MRRDADLSVVNAAVFSGSKRMFDSFSPPGIYQRDFRCIILRSGALLVLFDIVRCTGLFLWDCLQCLSIVWIFVCSIGDICSHVLPSRGSRRGIMYPRALKTVEGWNRIMRLKEGCIYLQRTRKHGSSMGLQPDEWDETLVIFGWA